MISPLYEMGALSPVASLNKQQIQAVREKFKHKFLLFTPERCILTGKHSLSLISFDLWY